MQRSFANLPKVICELALFTHYRKYYFVVDKVNLGGIVLISFFGKTFTITSPQILLKNEIICRINATLSFFNLC